MENRIVVCMGIPARAPSLYALFSSFDDPRPERPNYPRRGRDAAGLSTSRAHLFRAWVPEMSPRVRHFAHSISLSFHRPTTYAAKKPGLFVKGVGDLILVHSYHPGF